MADRRHPWALAGWLLLAVVTLVVLSGPLAPHGFVAGDPGVKLIAARNALAHPSRPWQTDLPQAGGRTYPLVDRMFAVHGDHAHALQSPTFPAISAPFLALFGLRGVYLLPALGFLALLPLTWMWVRAVAPQVPAHIVGIVTVLANPLFFYALEFWEHTPAAAVLAASSVLALGSHSSRAWAAVASGLLAGASVLLRPEAIWYAAALVALLWWRRDTHRRAWLWCGVGHGVVLAVYALVNYAEGGTWLGFHAGANLSVLGGRWLPARWERLVAWVLPLSPSFAVGVAGVVAAWLWRRSGAMLEHAQLLALVAGAWVAVQAATGHYVDSLWHAWPIGVLVAVPTRDARPMAPVWWMALATATAVWLTSTHDGGAQWGPRILLIVTPALLVLAATSLAQLTAPGRVRLARIAVVAVVVGCGAWSSRAAFLELRGWKRYYGTLARSIESHSQPGGVILTNVWWLDQIAASTYPARTFLVVSSPAEATATLQQLAADGVRTVSLAWSAEPEEPGPIDLTGTCFAVAERHDFGERAVTLARAECR